MTDRLLITGALVFVGAALFVLARSTHLQIIRRRLARSVQSLAPGLAAFQTGRPAVLYFTTEHCVPCRTRLKPALQRLTRELGNRFQVLEVNAELQTEAVAYWNVLSVPTIFVLDPSGKPGYVHYGVVGPEVLRDQLSDWLRPSE
jgi:thiol-disulfide isomerase/thioredoxin